MMVREPSHEQTSKREYIVNNGSSVITAIIGNTTNPSSYLHTEEHKDQGTEGYREDHSSKASAS